jgi:hypothetical protein
VKELAVAIKDADASTGAIAVHGIPGENAGVKAVLPSSEAMRMASRPKQPESLRISINNRLT